MPSTAIVSEQEYLTTTYHPDCDYVDGVLEERNLGTIDHSDLQTEIAYWFRLHRRQFGMNAYTEARVMVARRRYRIPDVTVATLPKPKGLVFTTAPCICIEVMSPDDTLASLRPRVDDYLRMGVENVWMLDPVAQVAWVARETDYGAVENGKLVTLDEKITLPLTEVFDPLTET